MDNVPQGDSCSSSRDDTIASGNSGAGQRRTGRSSSPASHSKAQQTDGEGHKPSKGSEKKRNALWTKMKFHADSKMLKKNPSCKFRHPPVCQNYTSEKGCVHGVKCHVRHVEAEGKPSKRSKKGGAKGSVSILKESFQLSCVSQDFSPRNSVPRELGKLGSKHAVKFSK